MSYHPNVIQKSNAIIQTHSNAIVCQSVQHVTDKAQSVLCGIFLNLNLVVWLCEDALSDYYFVVYSGLFS